MKVYNSRIIDDVQVFATIARKLSYAHALRPCSRHPYTESLLTLTIIAQCTVSFSSVNALLLRLNPTVLPGPVSTEMVPNRVHGRIPHNLYHICRRRHVESASLYSLDICATLTPRPTASLPARLRRTGLCRF